MQGTKSRANVAVESPSVRLFSDLFFTFMGFVAIAVLLAGVSFPRRIASGGQRVGAAQVQPSHAASVTIAQASIR